MKEFEIINLARRIGVFNAESNKIDINNILGYDEIQVKRVKEERDKLILVALNYGLFDTNELLADPLNKIKGITSIRKLIELITIQTKGLNSINDLDNNKVL